MIRYLLSLVLVCVVSSPALAVPNYTFTPLGSLLDSGVSAATDVNDLRQVVGQSDVGNGRHRAFVWEDGIMTDLGVLSGDGFSSASAINENGQITGTSDTDTGESRAFLYTDGEMINIGGLPGEISSEGRGINDAGQVVGSSFGNLGEAAFIYENGVMTSLFESLGISNAEDINENGQVIGSHLSKDESCFCIYIYDDGVVVDLDNPESAFLSANSINDNGKIVGGMVADGIFHAFLWESGEFIDIGTLPGFFFAEAHDINNNDQIVGRSLDVNGGVRESAFLYDDGSMYDLNDLTVNLGDWTLLEATAINNRGDIVGTAYNPGLDIRNAFLLTPITTDVPEPAAFTLVGLGLAGIFAARRRRMV